MENPGIIEELIKEAELKCREEPYLAEVFRNCFTNTLNTTVREMEDGTTHVITGDIPAMWLRDSTAQLRPYLLAAGKDEKLTQVIAGLVKRQFRCILTEPYANAFNETDNGNCWEKDFPDQNPWVWEMKFEVDSLCYPVQLAYLLWKNTGYTAHFDDTFLTGIKTIMDVFEWEQYHESRSQYRFQRKNAIHTDTLSRDGKGALVKEGCGLIWSGFRPSDDACTYGYLIPSNMFACVILGYMSEICREILHEEAAAQRAERLREEITAGIETYGIARTAEFGEIYAYETDGFGQYNLMDDANVPSLLSMEYLGYIPRRRDVAENTRRFLLSEANPYYYKGDRLSGIGSPHTPSRYVWHIAAAMEGLTAEKEEEKLQVLRRLAGTDGGKGMMHEGVFVDNPEIFTRKWFSWANAMYSELMLDFLGYRVKR